MMDQASNGLKDEGSDNNDANNGMSITSRELNVNRVSFRASQKFDGCSRRTCDSG